MNLERQLSDLIDLGTGGTISAIRSIDDVIHLCILANYYQMNSVAYILEIAAARTVNKHNCAEILSKVHGSTLKLLDHMCMTKLPDFKFESFVRTEEFLSLEIDSLCCLLANKAVCCSKIRTEQLVEIGMRWLGRRGWDAEKALKIPQRIRFPSMVHGYHVSHAQAACILR